ncbi:hypothetical protein GF343_05650 [Candidatus Woesearchaeota archaeon]|nr:hypothetical protein [Candidatus Woesearchaeota archaeon]
MLPEVYFLRYSFPCARVLVDVRKTITEKEWEKLKQAAETDTPLDRAYLERIFPVAIQRIMKINPDPWTVETIREYFWNRHEEAISKDLPPMIKRLCVVKKGKLVKQIGDVFRADLGDGDIRYVHALYPTAKAGDSAMIHYGYAVEKV